MSIEVCHITKTFGSFVALNDVSVHFPTGELVALLGPSGSGKTTLLRVIAGLETADAGTVLFDGEDATQRSAKDRRVGFVFQHYALFRHMTVFQNVAFGLTVKPKSIRPNTRQIQDRVMSLLKLVQLDWLADRYPSQLSGGQRQRVALARALAVEPKVLLLDEPFGALDAKVRKELRRWLRRLHDEIHVTSIFVTHDVEEALEVADRVVVMNSAEIEQIGTPDEVYENPATPFVYDFLGSTNILRIQLHNGHANVGEFAIPAPAHAAANNMAAVLFTRPHDVEIAREREDESLLQAEVGAMHTVGPVVRIELRAAGSGQVLEAEIGKQRFRELNLVAGERVYVRSRNPKIYAEDYSI